MKTLFTINDHLYAACVSEKTRSGFRHLASLKRDGVEIAKAKVTYLNRTWESYQFETALEKLLGEAKKLKVLSVEEQEAFQQTISQGVKEYEDEVNAGFKTIALAAKIGDVLVEGQQAKNDWKKRMLLAGIPDLDFPEDWESLSEDEKEARLEGVISELRKG